MSDLNKELFKLQLKNKALSENKKELKESKVKVNWLYPIGLEKQYKKEIKKILSRYIYITEERIIPNLVQWKEENDFNTDDLTDDMENINEEFEKLTNEIFITDKHILKGILLGLALQVSDFNNSQWQKILKNKLGVNFYIQEVWEEPLVKQWVTNNVELIKGLTTEYQKKINLTVFNAFQENKTMSTLSKELVEINNSFNTGYKKIQFKLKDGKYLEYKLLDYKKNEKLKDKISKLKSEGKIEFSSVKYSQSRADLISRDQISKLNGMISRERQRQIGIELYTWETSLDERVRGRPGGKYSNAKPSHWVMQSKVCSWEDPLVYADTIEEARNSNWKSRSSIGGVETHPSYEINCRCFGNPIFTELLDEVNKEL